MTFVAGQTFLRDVHAEAAITIFLLLTFAATLVHEAGHALAVKSLGARLRVIAVWDLGYDFESGRFGTQKYSGNREVAGYVRYTLNSAARSTYDHALIAVAGPTANVLTATMAIAPRVFAPVSTMTGAAAIFAILSIGQAVANLVPFPGSDGSAIWIAINNRHRTRA